MRRCNIIIILVLCLIAAIAAPWARLASVQHEMRCGPIALYAQEPMVPPSAPDREAPGPETGDSIYLVMAIVLAVWFILGGYLFRIDRKIAKLEKDIQVGE
jgi:CcmD family protein